MDHSGSWSDFIFIVVQSTLKFKLGSVGSIQVIQGVTRSLQSTSGQIFLWSNFCTHIFDEMNVDVEKKKKKVDPINHYFRTMFLTKAVIKIKSQKEI